MDHDQLRRAASAADAERETTMQHNEPGREPTEPTDAELELVLDLYRAARRLAGNKTLADVQAVIDAANEVPWSAMKRLSGQRPCHEPAEPAKPETCEWIQDWEGNWTGTCGVYWITDDVGSMKHCPNCGRTVTATPYTEPEEDDDAE